MTRDAIVMETETETETVYPHRINRNQPTMKKPKL